MKDIARSFWRGGMAAVGEGLREGNDVAEVRPKLLFISGLFTASILFLTVANGK